MARALGKYGLESKGEQRLQELHTLIGGLGKVVKQPAVVGTALDAYKQGVAGIIKLTGVARENEYQKFKQQLGGLTGAKAKEKYDEISAGFVAEWVGFHWIRYQAEILQEKLNAMPNP